MKFSTKGFSNGNLKGCSTIRLIRAFVLPTETDRYNMANRAEFAITLRLFKRQRGNRAR